MKLVIIRLLLFTLVSLLALKAVFAQEPTQERPRRFIFLIHGINGSLKTFGSLPQVLQNHGSQIQPDYDISVIPLNYATGKSFSTYDFAHDISRQMLKAVGTLRPTDSINIVAHSQGGLVSWIWYLLSYGKEPGFDYFALASQTESIMTLGSPMWGSKMASFLRDNPRITDWVKGENWGKSELGEMGFSSDTIYRFRRRAVLLDQENFHLPIRSLSIAGVLNSQFDRSVPWYYRGLLGIAESHLGPGGSFQTESDLAVDVSSARLDFIYLKKGTGRNNTILSSDFTHFNEKAINNFRVVRGPHLSWSQNTFFDIAEVPESCIDITNPCTQQTYPLILGFTMACTDKITNCNKPLLDRLTETFTTSNKGKVSQANNLDILQMHSFLLDIVVDLPKGYRYPQDSAEILKYIEFPGRSGDRIFSTDKKFIFRINRGLEMRSATTRISEKYNQIRVTLHGHVYHNYSETDGDAKVYAANAERGFKLPMNFTLPGFEQRKIEVLVKPTYSTFINLQY